MDYIFENETTPFMKVKAMDVIFKGLELDCSFPHKFEAKVGGWRWKKFRTCYGNIFLRIFIISHIPKAVCAAIRSEGAEQGVRIINDTHIKISLLGHVSLKP
jgi:hypothetical protein